MFKNPDDWGSEVDRLFLSSTVPYNTPSFSLLTEETKMIELSIQYSIYSIIQHSKYTLL